MFEEIYYMYKFKSIQLIRYTMDLKVPTLKYILV